ncbi:MAG: 30S ribosomal protein S4 [Candidatus Bathyarchaeia archaeon]
MGDPKRQRKKYETPRHPWREAVLAEELTLIGKYGLRNKRELWVHKTTLRKMRDMARSALGMSSEKRAKLEGELLRRLQRLNLVAENPRIDDVLDLGVEDILDRRLQSRVYRLGLAQSPHQARQLITHGHIAVSGKIITSPGYLVTREEEAAIEYGPGSSIGSSDHPLRRLLTAAVSPSPTSAEESKSSGE